MKPHVLVNYDFNDENYNNEYNDNVDLNDMNKVCIHLNQNSLYAQRQS